MTITPPALSTPTTNLLEHPRSHPTQPQLNQPRQIQLDDVLQALRLWHKDSPEPNPLTDLYIVQSLHQSGHSSNRHAVNSVLSQALDQLAIENAEYESLLRHRFLDRKTVYEVANHLNIAESTLHMRQKQAIQQLTLIILQMEEAARQERCAQLLRTLDLQPATNLIGIERNVEELAPILVTHSSSMIQGCPMIIGIEGIGGIGKTTLTDQLVRHVIYHDITWEQVAWVTARQNELTMSGMISDIESPALTTAALIEQLYEQLLPDHPRPPSYDKDQVLAALENHLTTHKCLVVVDNLETIEDVESLLPMLRQLANPTKFILTSRKSYYAARDVYHFQVPQLTNAESLALVRRVAEESNLPQVAAASDDELCPIFETVGGNPLALRLVTGQLHFHGLQEVLDDLKEARTDTVENLYTFIFRRAWDHLGEPARRALIAMILVTGDGDTINELLATCDLKRNELRNALKQLVTLNLVDSRGGLNERRYSIHNLTRSFLHKQVVMWSTPPL